MQKRSWLYSWIFVGVMLVTSGVWGQQAGLREGDYVAVIGDSITEQRLYSMFIEDYLLMCKPAANLQVTQFGWGGETAPGFAARMANDVLRLKPTVATTCFGMNDGGYSPMNEEKASRYQNAQKSIITQLKQANVRFIIAGSPGVVDADMFRQSRTEAVMYNKTLGAERDIMRTLAEKEGVTFANVHDPMMAAMTKAKAKNGPKYHLAGPDGFHPDRNGHLVMAYAFLKAMGVSGEIGKITIDMANGSATASDGHKVLSCGNGVVEIESTKYPFCFYGNPANTNSTLGVLPFVPFNEELNRFVLVVANAKSPNVKVTWGNVSKVFSAKQLAEGINLAAEFAAGNPFSGPFAAVEAKIAAKQGREVQLFKYLLHAVPEYETVAPSEKDALERVAGMLGKEDQKLREEVAAAVVPVKHTIQIEAGN